MQWSKREIDPSAIRSIAQRWQISLLLATILYRRSISDIEGELEYFFNRSITDQHSPFLLHDILPALTRIERALENNERIMIFGDRDVDGITATVVLVKGLEANGMACMWSVPCEDEPYGLSSAAVQKCVTERITLIITVDCGISNRAEIALARKHGIDTIVIDHHNPPDSPPAACAIIDPKQDDCHYPYPLVSGCVLACKVILALRFRLAATDVTFPQFIAHCVQNDTLFCELMAFAAISTIADMMPLRNENRIIVNYGMRCVQECKNEGLHALLRKKEIPAVDINARMLSFNIIPLLNAAGRLGHADLAVRLLLTTDIRAAAQHAEQIIATHRQQKNITNAAWRSNYTEARDSYQDLDGQAVLMCGEEFPYSITGLLANKLQQEFKTVAIVIVRGAHQIRGSIRCDEQYRATDLTHHFSEYLSDWGGHDRAAGFSVLPDRYQQFVTDLRQYLRQQHASKKNAHAVQIDAEIPLPMLNDSLFDANRMLEPFGQQFPLITYYTRAVVISSIKLLGKDECHVKLLLNTGTVKVPAVFWNCSAHLGNLLKEHNTIDIIYHVEVNHFRHNREQRLSIIDVAPCGVFEA